MINLIYQHLVSPLPEEWKAGRHQDKIFYFNVSDGSTHWNHPLDIMVQQQIEMAKSG